MVWLDILLINVGVPMCTNCAPPVADLFFFSYERDFMLSLSDNNQAGQAVSTSRYSLPT